MELSSGIVVTSFLFSRGSRLSLEHFSLGHAQFRSHFPTQKSFGSVFHRFGPDLGLFRPRRGEVFGSARLFGQIKKVTFGQRGDMVTLKFDIESTCLTE